MNGTTTLQPFQSIADTATLTGLSQFSLRKRIKEGSVKYLKSGNKYFINVPDLLKREGLRMDDLVSMANNKGKD